MLTVALAVWLPFSAAQTNAQDIATLNQAQVEPTTLIAKYSYGGSVDDLPTAVATDSSGNIYIAGITLSPDFPADAGSPVHPDILSCPPSGVSYELCTGALFLMKLSPDAKTVLFSTLLVSGQRVPGALALGVGESGTIALVGAENGSTPLPVFPGTHQSSCTAALACGFILLVDSSGHNIIGSSFFGGTIFTNPFQVLVDSENKAWVLGYTESPDFSTTPNAVQTKFGGGYNDGFLAVFGQSGNLVYSTLFGGNGGDGADGAILDNQTILLAGATDSSNFPFLGSTACPATGVDHAFMAKLSLAQGLLALDCVGEGFQTVLNSPLVSPDGSFYAAYFNQSVPITGDNYDPLSALLFSKKSTGEAQTFLYPKFWRSRVWNWNKQSLLIAFSPIDSNTQSYKQTLATFSLSTNRLQAAFSLPEPLDGTPDPIVSSKGYYVAPSHLAGPKGIHLTLFDLNERQLAFSNPNGNTIRPGEDFILTVTPSSTGHSPQVQFTCTADGFACSVTPQSQVISGPTEIHVQLASPTAKSKFMLTSALCLLGLIAASKKRTLAAALTLLLFIAGCGASHENAQQQVVLTASTPEQTVQTTLQIARN